MFDHSIKVPRLYKTASRIAKHVSEGKGSIKQLVYEGKHPNIKALYALVVHIFQRSDVIEQLFKKSKLLIKEPRFDPWLAKVLITELLWGKKHLSGPSKPIQTILAYEQIFKAHLSDVSSSFQDYEQVYKPRYVRINTLKTTVNEVVETFINEGWILKRYTDTNNYLGFIDAVRNLGSEEFMIDLHIPYLLIFPAKTQFYQHHFYKNSTIILQDKASCLPVHILNPESGSTVLDMCAAPGMKTTQCAAIMENKGQIHAVEIGKKRYQTLTKIIESSGATCINAINADVLTLFGKEYPDVEYILVDPSCSGSGITDRVEIGQQEIDQHKNRLEKLAGFQIKILRHALTKFPKVKRVVYSTCSVYPEENEDVVRQVLETCFYFKLVPANEFVQNKWKNFGSPDFGDIGNYSLYAKPDIDLTSGFFVAVFERLQEGETNSFLNKNIFSLKMHDRGKKRKKESQQEVWENAEVTKECSNVNNLEKDDKNQGQLAATLEIQQNQVSMETLKKKKKEKNSVDQNFLGEDIHIFEQIFASGEIVIKTEKNENKKQDIIDIKSEDYNNSVHDSSKKKKKKNKKVEIIQESTTNFEKSVVDDSTVSKKKKSKKQYFTETHLMQHDKTIRNRSDNAIKRKNKKDKRDKTKLANIEKILEDDNDSKNNEIIDPTIDILPHFETVESSKKKKKKKRTSENIFDENLIEWKSEVNKEIVHKKKKKKRNEEGNFDTTLEDNKNSVDIHNTDNFKESVVIDDAESSSRKKVNKLKLEENVIFWDDELVKYENTSTIYEKKKKQERHQVKAVNMELNDENLKENHTKKKKKRRNKDI